MASNIVSDTTQTDDTADEELDQLSPEKLLEKLL